MHILTRGSITQRLRLISGLILFLFSWAVNLLASAFVFKQRKRAERLLS